MLNSSTALLAIGVFVLFSGIAFILLLVTGGINSRYEEDHWTEYWLDTPTTDRRVVLINSDAPAADQDSNENWSVRKAA